MNRDPKFALHRRLQDGNPYPNPLVTFWHGKFRDRNRLPLERQDRFEFQEHAAWRPALRLGHGFGCAASAVLRKVVAATFFLFIVIAGVDAGQLVGGIAIIAIARMHRHFVFLECRLRLQRIVDAALHAHVSPVVRARTENTAPGALNKVSGGDCAELQSHGARGHAAMGGNRGGVVDATLQLRRSFGDAKRS